MPPRTIILGIDPGSLVTGYGIIEVEGGRLRMVASGMVRNGASHAVTTRLRLIHESLGEVIRRFKPHQVAVETAFYGKNAQSALKLGQARGVAILAAASVGLPLAEYSPREVKKAVAGNGNASKERVQVMVRSLLGLSGPPPALDITDALAVAICHGHRSAASGSRRNGWSEFVRDHPERVRPPGTRR